MLMETEAVAARCSVAVGWSLAQRGARAYAVGAELLLLLGVKLNPHALQGCR